MLQRRVITFMCDERTEMRINRVAPTIYIYYIHATDRDTTENRRNHRRAPCLLHRLFRDVPHYCPAAVPEVSIMNHDCYNKNKKNRCKDNSCIGCHKLFFN